MILYCAVCYAIALGMLINERDTIDDLSIIDILIFAIAPISIPVLVGMYINNR